MATDELGEVDSTPAPHRARFGAMLRELMAAAGGYVWTLPRFTRSGPVGPTCAKCQTIHGADAAVAVGRFNPDGVDGYRSRLGGALRATRAEAIDDFCTSIRAAALTRARGNH